MGVSIEGGIIFGKQAKTHGGRGGEDIVKAENVYINILNFDILMERARLQAAAVEQLLRDGLLDEREASLLVQRIGEYISSHIEMEIKEQSTATPIPAVFEDAFNKE